jgi:FKBP-type peptidyl-prolyl cis-trans isomerase SlpA
MNDVPVSENTRIFLNFGLFLEDGETVDSNLERDPVSFVYGDGSLLPGFEKRLLGMTAGEEGSFQIPPEDGFGQPNDNNIQVIKREHFSGEEQLERGMMFSFKDASGGELPGVIASVDEEEVHVDFNHPLAGRTITFRVRIDRVEPAELH